MKRILLILLTVIFVSSMLFVGTGCKEEAAETTEEQAQTPETEEAEEEVPAEESDMTIQDNAEKVVDWSKLPAAWKNDNVTQPAWSGKEVPPQTNDTPIKVGWCPQAMIPYYQLVLTGVNEAIESLGGEDVIDLIVQSPATHEEGVAEQVSILEMWIGQKVDAILITAVDDGGIKPMIEKAAECNIPVMEFNMPLQMIKNDYYVTNLSTSGVEAATAMGNWLNENYGDEPHNVAIVEGLPSIHNDMRKNSFIDAIKDNPNFTIVASQTADWDREKAARVMENMLTAHPDIDVVYALYDDMAMGAIQSIKARGLMDKITVLGYDLTTEGLESIKKGEMAASVYNGAKQMGYDSIIAVYKYVVEGIMVPKAIYGKPRVIDQSNVDSFTDF